MNKRASQGKCNLCGNIFKKTGITRHLKSCIVDKEGKNSSTKGKTLKKSIFFHISLEDRYLPEYWMHVEMSTDSKLSNLDDFLRRIWLECCGHLSAFTIDEIRYSVSPMREYGEKGMNAKLGNVLRPEMKFFYEYDFGTPTHLTLKVVSEYVGQVRGKKPCILARNAPPEVKCELCGNHATEVCVQCICDDEGWLCDDCAGKHECGVDMLLPVVNSPRVGMCGYTGKVE